MTIDKMAAPFVEWAKSVQARLNFEYEYSRSILTHGTVIGSIREAVVRDILRKFLPPSTTIGTGQIIDSYGGRSNQIDIIVSRGDAPVFQFEGDISAFLCESVLATVEVKSMLYRDKVIESLENCKSVRKLTVELEFLTSKGTQVFDEALEFIRSIGGVEKYDVIQMGPLNIGYSPGIPYEVAKVLPFVAYWLHWRNGDFANQHIIESVLDKSPLYKSSDLDFFASVLQFALKQPDFDTAMLRDFHRAEEIQEAFFATLYGSMLNEYAYPVTLVLAYGGYESLDNMITEVRNWYDKNRETIDWSDLPSVIMNQRMFMYRSYNQYYCSLFEYPVLWLMYAICDKMASQFAFPISPGANSGIDVYFHLDSVLGMQHPRYSPHFTTWTIPIDRASAGDVVRQNRSPDLSKQLQVGRQNRPNSKTNRKKH